MQLILASTSPYRRRLLERLGQPFTCEAPQVDETPAADENAADLATRLAIAKAAAVAARHPGAWVLGSDQVASLDHSVLGKPGDHATAHAQLRASSGREVVFDTAVSLQGPGFAENRRVSTTVAFRELTAAQIDTYLAQDQPFDCAGSFKWECLGIALFRHLRGDDPTALEGLPLIATCDLLAAAGYPVLAAFNSGGSSDR